MALSPDSKTVATGLLTGKVLLQEVRPDSPLGEPLDVGVGSVHGLAFSPDGKTLAGGRQ